MNDISPKVLLCMMQDWLDNRTPHYPISRNEYIDTDDFVKRDVDNMRAKILTSVLNSIYGKGN